MESLEKANKKMMEAITPHMGIPTQDYMPQYVNRTWLYWAYYFEGECSILSDIIQKKRNETFRNRIEWQPNFVKKCTKCQKEFQIEVEQCDKCGGGVRDPDYGELDTKTKREDGVDFLDRANRNGQSMVDVLKACDFHTEVADNLFLLCRESYKLLVDGTIKSRKPRDFFALDPRDITILFNEAGELGKAGSICLAHRGTLVNGNGTGSRSEPRMDEELKNCPECGRQLYPAWYLVQTSNAPSQYYTEDEIVHASYYYPSMLYGFPLPLKLQHALWAYTYIERRTRSFYETARPPGIMFVPATNQDALLSAWANMVEQMKQDPYTIPVLATSESAPTQANLVRFLNDPNLDLIAVKNELRERIASRYEVTVTLNQDSKQGGNADGKHAISMTDRAIEGKQKWYNEHILPWIVKKLGVKDFKLVVRPHLNENEMAKEQLLALKIQNARAMLMMGFEVKYEKGSFEYSGQPMTYQELMEMEQQMATAEGKSMEQHMADNPMDMAAPDRVLEPTPPRPATSPYARNMNEGKKRTTLKDMGLR